MQTYTFIGTEQFPSDLPKSIDTNELCSNGLKCTSSKYINASSSYTTTSKIGKIYFTTSEPCEIKLYGKASKDASVDVRINNRVSGSIVDYLYLNKNTTSYIPYILLVKESGEYSFEIEFRPSSNVTSADFSINSIIFPMVETSTSASTTFPLQENIIDAVDLSLKENIAEAGGTAELNAREKIYEGILTDYIYPKTEQYPSDLPQTIDLSQTYTDTAYFLNNNIYLDAKGDGDTTHTSIIQFTTPQPNTKISMHLASAGKSQSTTNNIVTRAKLDNELFYSKSGQTLTPSYQYIELDIAEAGEHLLRFESYCPNQEYGNVDDKGYARLIIKEIHFPVIGIEGIGIKDLVLMETILGTDIENLLLKEIAQEKVFSRFDLHESIYSHQFEKIELKETIELQGIETSLLLLEEKVEAKEADVFNLIQKIYGEMNQTLNLLEKAGISSEQTLSIKEQIEALINTSMISLFEKAVDAGQSTLNIAEKAVLSEQVKLSLKERIKATDSAFLSLIERIYSFQEKLLLLTEKVSEKGTCGVSIIEDISKLGLLLLKERVIATKPVINNMGNTFFIPFNQEVVVYGEEVLDEATGDLTFGEGKFTKAYVAYEVTEVQDFYGKQTLSNIKVYLPSNVMLNAKSKIEIGEKSYSLKQLAIKKHLSGQIAYFVCYL